MGPEQVVQYTMDSCKRVRLRACMCDCLRIAYNAWMHACACACAHLVLQNGCVQSVRACMCNVYMKVVCRACIRSCLLDHIANPLGRNGASPPCHTRTFMCTGLRYGRTKSKASHARLVLGGMGPEQVMQTPWTLANTFFQRVLFSSCSQFLPEAVTLMGHLSLIHPRALAFVHVRMHAHCALQRVDACVRAHAHVV